MLNTRILQPLRIAAMVLLLCGLTLTALAAETLGVVVLHGKESQPAFMEQVTTSFSRSGFLVETPEMPWSRRRLYDASFEQALLEIDAAVERLRARGATRIAITGLSMGGPAVFAYGATRPHVDGLVAWAPAHDPVNDPSMRTPQFLEAVARAQQLIASGRGDDPETFPDINRTLLSVRATPRVWLSYWSPDGSNSMPANAARITRPTPILIVVTPRDPFPQDEDYLLKKAPGHPLSKLVKVDAAHPQVPGASRDQTIEWLKQIVAAPK